MYAYIAKAKVKKCRKYCSKKLTELTACLKEDGIRAHYHLIGSGANRMVASDGGRPFDLDYNIVFTKLPKQYEDAPERLKKLVSRHLDAILRDEYRPGQDTRSAIIYEPIQITPSCHKMDIGLVRRVAADLPYSRLIHDKAAGKFCWNEIRSSEHLAGKVKEIKASGLYPKLKTVYLRKKEQYRGDQNHPSFIVYIEAVNEVWQSMHTV